MATEPNIDRIGTHFQRRLPVLRLLLLIPLDLVTETEYLSIGTFGNLGL